ncbi:MAG: hypothetical protein M3R38_17370, partial [Actinomycetota bacterium]|nr:hypothetical protein [Actinomycetota bacterium]
NSVDVERGEMVDTELDRLISRRAAQDRRPDPDEQEEIWKASVRRYHDARRSEHREAWRGWHLEQAARIERAAAALVEGHRRRAEELLCQETIEKRGARA